MNTNAVLAVAAELRRQADALEELVRQTNQAETNARITALDVVRQLCDEGTPEAAAIEAAATMLDLDVRSVRWAWRWSQDAEKREWRRTLPLRVADLTAAGVRDAEIARIIGIPRQQVPRIRRRMREAAEGTKKGK
ncbi:hypothetical protein ACM64Y_01820 [Novispirillum sp. DQ9]|uniref:hypothetical protein n=1 Tax=Novispirillum sp. DQ9 TaxID=3398612 RepID=UPI003C7C5648